MSDLFARHIPTVKILKQGPYAVWTPIVALLALIPDELCYDFEDVSKWDSLFSFSFHFQHVLGSMKISLASRD